MAGFVSVKGFERFQHYKDRAPPWIKLYNELLENYEFGRLPDVAKGQLLCIWLLASRTENKIPADAQWIGSKIQATSPVDLPLLLDLGWLVPWVADEAKGRREDWPTRYIPDVTKEAVRARDGHQCRRCGTKDRLEIDHITPISQGGSNEASNLQLLCMSCNRKKRAEQMRSKGSAEAEQMRSPEERRGETETETEKIPPPSGAPPTVVDPTGMQQAVDEWNRLAPALGLATTRWPLSKDRAQKLRARLTDCGGVEGWIAALEKVRRSPLLNGTAPRSGRHANWRCSFDFLIRAEAFERLMEGKYDGRSGLADIAEQHAAIDRALGLEAGG